MSRATVHTQQTAEAGPLDGRLVHDLHGEPLVAGHARHPPGEHRRRQGAARLVDQVAGQYDPGHDRRRLLNGGAHPGCGTAHQNHPGQGVVALGSGGRRFVAELVQGQGHALDYGPASLRGT